MVLTVVSSNLNKYIINKMSDLIYEKLWRPFHRRIFCDIFRLLLIDDSRPNDVFLGWRR
jgi:hypothetical protein